MDPAWRIESLLAAAHWALRVQRLALFSWTAFARKRHHRRVSVNLACSREDATLGRRLRKATMVAWAKTAVKRSALRRFICRLQLVGVGAVVVLWRRAVGLVGQMRRSGASMDGHRLRQSFNAWSGSANQLRCSIVAIGVVKVRLENATTSRLGRLALKHWRCATTLQPEVLQVGILKERRSAMVCVEVVLRGWAAFSIQMGKTRQWYVSRRHNHLCATVIGAWGRIAPAQQRADSHCVGASIRRCWFGWQRWLLERRIRSTTFARLAGEARSKRVFRRATTALRRFWLSAALRKRCRHKLNSALARAMMQWRLVARSAALGEVAVEALEGLSDDSRVKMRPTDEPKEGSPAPHTSFVAQLQSFEQAEGARSSQALEQDCASSPSLGAASAAAHQTSASASRRSRGGGSSSQETPGTGTVASMEDSLEWSPQQAQRGGIDALALPVATPTSRPSTPIIMTGSGSRSLFGTASPPAMAPWSPQRVPPSPARTPLLSPLSASQTWRRVCDIEGGDRPGASLPSEPPNRRLLPHTLPSPMRSLWPCSWPPHNLGLGLAPNPSASPGAEAKVGRSPTLVLRCQHDGIVSAIRQPVIVPTSGQDYNLRFCATAFRLLSDALFLQRQMREVVLYRRSKFCLTRRLLLRTWKGWNLPPEHTAVYHTFRPRIATARLRVTFAAWTAAAIALASESRRCLRQALKCWICASDAAAIALGARQRLILRVVLALWRSRPRRLRSGLATLDRFLAKTSLQQTWLEFRVRAASARSTHVVDCAAAMRRWISWVERRRALLSLMASSELHCLQTCMRNWLIAVETARTSPIELTQLPQLSVVQEPFVHYNGDRTSTSVTSSTSTESIVAVLWPTPRTLARKPRWQQRVPQTRRKDTLQGLQRTFVQKRLRKVNMLGAAATLVGAQSRQRSLLALRAWYRLSLAWAMGKRLIARSLSFALRACLRGWSLPYAAACAGAVAATHLIRSVVASRRLRCWAVSTRSAKVHREVRRRSTRALLHCAIAALKSWRRHEVAVRMRLAAACRRIAVIGIASWLMAIASERKLALWRWKADGLHRTWLLRRGCLALMAWWIGRGVERRACSNLRQRRIALRLAAWHDARAHARATLARLDQFSSRVANKASNEVMGLRQFVVQLLSFNRDIEQRNRQALAMLSARLCELSMDAWRQACAASRRFLHLHCEIAHTRHRCCLSAVLHMWRCATAFERDAAAKKAFAERLRKVFLLRRAVEGLRYTAQLGAMELRCRLLLQTRNLSCSFVAWWRIARDICRLRCCACGVELSRNLRVLRQSLLGFLAVMAIRSASYRATLLISRRLSTRCWMGWRWLRQRRQRLVKVFTQVTLWRRFNLLQCSLVGMRRWVMLWRRARCLNLLVVQRRSGAWIRRWTSIRRGQHKEAEAAGKLSSMAFFSLKTWAATLVCERLSVALMSKKRSAPILRSWVGAASLCKMLRARVASVSKWWRIRFLQKLLRSWHQKSTAKKVMRRLQRISSCRLCTSTFTKWLYCALLRQHLRKNVTDLRLRQIQCCKRSVFRKMDQWLRRSAWIHWASGAVWKRYRSACLSRLAQATLRCRVRADRRTMADRFARKTMCLRVVVAWNLMCLQLAREGQLRQGGLRRFLSLWISCWRLWATWRRRVEVAGPSSLKSCRRVVAIWSGDCSHPLPAILASWRETVRELRAFCLAERFRRDADSATVFQRLSIAWYGWTNICAAHLQELVRVQQVRLRRLHCHLRLAAYASSRCAIAREFNFTRRRMKLLGILIAWRATASKHRLNASLAGMFRSSVCRRYLATWAKLSKRLGGTRILLDRRCRRLLSDCWSGFLRLARRERSGDEISRQAIVCRLLGSLHMWRRATEFQQIACERQRQRQLQLVRSALAAWMLMLVRLNLARALALRRWRQRMTVLLSEWAQLWKLWVAASTSLVPRFAQRRLQEAVCAWSRRVNLQRTKSGCVTTLSQLSRQRLVLSHWACLYSRHEAVKPWLLLTETRMKRRLLATSLAVFVAGARRGLALEAMARASNLRIIGKIFKALIKCLHLEMDIHAFGWHWSLKRLKQFLHAWFGLVLRTNTCGNVAKDRYMKAIRSVAKELLSSWIEFKSAHRSALAKCGERFAVIENTLLGMTFSCWRSTTRWQLGIRTFVAHSALRLQRAAVAEWRRGARHQRVLSLFLASRVVIRKRVALMQWRLGPQHRFACIVATRKIERNRRRASLAKWWLCAKCKVAFECYTKRIESSWKRVALGEWRCSTEHNLVVTKRLSLRCSLHKKTRAFQVWRLGAQRSVVLRSLALQSQTSHVCLALRRWWRSVRYQGALRQLLSRTRLNFERAALASWLSGIKRQYVLRTLAVRTHLNQKKAAVIQWRSSISHQLASRSFAVRGDLNRERVALSQWRSNIQHLSDLRRQIARSTLNRKQFAWAQWLCGIHRKLVVRQHAQRRNIIQKQSAWGGWRNLVVLQCAGRALAYRMDLNRKCLALASWRLGVKQQLALFSFLCFLTRRYEAGCICFAFTEWKTGIRHQRSVDALTCCCTRRRLRVALDAWKHSADIQRVARSKMLRILSTSFLSWSANLHARGTERATMMTFLQLWRCGIDRRREILKRMRRFWYCCRQGNLLAAEVATRLVVAFVLAWQEVCGRDRSLERRRELLVALRRRPLEVSFLRFLRACQLRRRDLSSLRLARAAIAPVHRELAAALCTWSAQCAVAQLQARCCAHMIRNAWNAWCRVCRWHLRLSAALLHLQRALVERGWAALRRFSPCRVVSCRRDTPISQQAPNMDTIPHATMPSVPSYKVAFISPASNRALLRRVLQSWQGISEDDCRTRRRTHLALAWGSRLQLSCAFGFWVLYRRSSDRFTSRGHGGHNAFPIGSGTSSSVPERSFQTLSHFGTWHPPSGRADQLSLLAALLRATASCGAG